MTALKQIIGAAAFAASDIDTPYSRTPRAGAKRAAEREAARKYPHTPEAMEACAARRQSICQARVYRWMRNNPAGKPPPSHILAMADELGRKVEDLRTEAVGGGHK